MSVKVLNPLRIALICSTIWGTANLSAAEAPPVESDPENPAESIAESFPECITRLQAQARHENLPEPMIAVLGQVQPIPRTIELDRNQPEFVQTFANYFNRRVTNYRISQGRELLAEHRDFLKGLTERFGVPGQYLVAFWAMESNFGRNIGKMPILNTLATLACDERRSAFFTGELFNALRLMDRHQVAVDDMQGSWAGAIGQTQFMPSAYLKYGIDGDGDQRVDLWQSRADALTSAAYYLQQLGWQRELRWGREVKLPAEFPYQLAGLDRPQTLGQWQALGVVKADNSALAGDAEQTLSAALLVPAGHNGPKFLVYDNFAVMMRWNRSEYYALSVGVLADRINGAGHLRQPPLNTTPLTKDQVMVLQQALTEHGFDPGVIDGQLGPQTRRAIRDYQASQSLVADGFADQELLKTVQQSQ
ncbi:lytic murein transglycosylase [Halioxenophilus sp. WMMB6]|uniref:lytic murein transglycosylase n=1 Tax=Halioxenophilus sp. WMMB6 TaxID=3073815 RepID=UPI00295EBD3E|nr:lytic murein transglycosylase [Halioxenophilus sp. WMMB6]